ncbi:hypothetical protein V493_00375 [Pseudogymnoascus sp. VKM F-4281 (FW-2241)]|nr:hypothetical protein V493_00375 [Pseudogymnoascus sp. VKM F-4281 (FW-2241)]
MTQLLDLPVEIIATILSSLGLSGVCALASTNKRLHSICDPFLYQQDGNGGIPRALRWASERGKMGTFQKALEVIEDVNISDEDKRTALHCTAYCYNEIVDEMVKYLVESKAFLNAICFSETALGLACKNQNFRCAMALIKAGAELTDCLLVNCASRIEAKSQGGVVPDEVMDESARLQEALILKLVEMGVPINWWPSNDENGQTALMRAACHGNTSAVELLLRVGADANSKGANDITPLMCAVGSRNCQCVELLVNAGADVKLKMEYGLSAIYFLPPGEITQDTSCIWAQLVSRGSNIEEALWYADYGDISILELAIYEALEGNCLPLDLIVEHSKCVSDLSIRRVLRLLEEVEYNSSHFLERCEREVDGEW